MPGSKALISLLPALLVALWGCAPAAMMGPPVPLAVDTPLEISAAAVGSGPVTPEGEGGCSLLWGCRGVSGQLSGRVALSERLEVGGVVYGGNISGAGAGVYGRLWYVDAPRFRLGGELQGGFAWAAAALPMAGMVSERVWITASPSVGLRHLSVVRVPLGVGVQLSERWWLQGELAVGWDPWRVFQDPEQVHLQGALSLSWRPAL
ncbi:MAG: hypothetical protein VX899_02140 [Myxococcota bacterium]|nr:hypothetical protein [Myxococcota bacterium]